MTQEGFGFFPAAVYGSVAHLFQPHEWFQRKNLTDTVLDSYGYEWLSAGRIYIMNTTVERLLCSVHE
jgi:succinate-acetate transporter protein